jgi:hypothetical protein
MPVHGSHNIQLVKGKIMLKNQKRKMYRNVVVAVIATLLSNAAQSLPSAACDSLTRTRIAEFRAKVSRPETGTIALLQKANSEGAAAGDPVTGIAGGWNYIDGLRAIAGQLDETAFGPTTCKTLFYPSLPEYGPSSGAADPNNIHACFRVDVTPALEHEMYWSTLHVWYNKVGYASRPSAEAAFYAVRDLLRDSRGISNDALTCLLESTGDPALGGP